MTSVERGLNNVRSYEPTAAANPNPHLAASFVLIVLGALVLADRVGTIALDPLVDLAVIDPSPGL